MEPTVLTVPAPAAAPAPDAKAPVIPGKTPASPEATPKPDANGAKPAGDGKITEVKKDPAPADPNKPYKIKVNGQEHSVSLEELQEMAQKGMGAESKFKEAAKMRKMADDFFRLLRTDPMAILENPKIGIDFKKLAQDFIARQIELESMTPEQREFHETKQKLKVAEDEKKTMQEKAQQEQFDTMKKHFSDTYEKDIMSTLETASVPKTRFTVQRIAYYMAEGLKRGIELKAADVIDFVKIDHQKIVSDTIGSLDGDALAALLGDVNVKKLNEAQLKKIQPGNPPAINPVPVVNGTGDTKKLDRDDWRKHMDQKYGK